MKRVIRRKHYINFDFSKLPLTKTMRQGALRLQRYDYFGIPYGGFDGWNSHSEGIFISEEHKRVCEDAEQARMLILQELELPQELEDRLYKYKQDNLLEKYNA